jgi:hypothetical protein
MMTTGCMAACIRDFNQCVRANDAGAIFSMRTAGDGRACIRDSNL